MSYVSGQLRQLVIKRAQERCEYCLFPQSAALLIFEMEHIIAEKHGGKTDAENLALACPYCNRAKGSDLGSIDPETKKLTPFFNPRSQKWSEHFQLDGGEIKPLTGEGRVTVAVLQFNQPERLQERERLIAAFQYP
ncbi:MAG TPA: HNH endonuclease [Cyanobacteria bacterium UBA11149]|nr:HNH endonuclease [Cyanobacteria bacterium UBA11367]HBE60635.1 HNH endonuclease [Cyanobacteria bacterium UBA11366]HBK63984.1 HNH endonuclease [Cyanobacteria bacterium UBA11166]HBR73915.1 HNH endonuclease [Cyanobacteria bacterium UBA11159]HBS72473.1 HNH endonuclease [Cyanobacteria bacterium UBA11153]HBW91866.1 HNH endonuclease [Cyanobacteria bacterium UBA11149]HCA96864.1 HNH endonuclease [Cyanobacteria bacterium UBA9226]